MTTRSAPAPRRGALTVSIRHPKLGFFVVQARKLRVRLVVQLVTAFSRCTGVPGREHEMTLNEQWNDHSCPPALCPCR